MANGESVDKEIIRGSRYSRSARWNGPSQSASLDVGGVGGSLGGEGGSCAVTGEREAVATNSSAARKGSGHSTLLPVLRSVAKSHMSPPTRVPSSESLLPVLRLLDPVDYEGSRGAAIRRPGMNHAMKFTHSYDTQAVPRLRVWVV